MNLSDDSCVRKRPRSPSRPNSPTRPRSPIRVRASSSPLPTFAPSIGKPRAGVPDGKSLSRRLLCNETSRIEALNDLLRITASHEINYALDGDKVLNALTNIFYDVIGWNPEGENEDDANDVIVNLDDKKEYEKNDDNDDKDEPRFLVKEAWNGPLTRECRKWESFCKSNLCKDKLTADDLKYLDVILTIFRNLSFVSANLRLLAYSNDILSILVGCLYEESSKQAGGSDDSNGNGNVLSINALSILINLAPHLDVTGQKLFCDKLFLSAAATGAGPEEGAKLPDESSFGQAVGGSWGFGSLLLAKKLDTREDFVQDIEKEMLLQLTQDYLVRVYAIFPALCNVLTDTRTTRNVNIIALELLQEFVNHANVDVFANAEDQDPDEIPDTRAILINIPPKLLKRLADFLYIPRLGSDALEYINPISNIVTRVNPMKLQAGYDGSVDTDIRDRTLEVFVPLLQLDSTSGIAKQLGTNVGTGLPNTRVFDSIFPILSTQTGRNEAPLLSIQLLRELSKAKENRPGCLYLQERIIALASKEPRVAHLAFNHLYVQEDMES